MKPIFIFSLPRSGSTLLQRILATHDEITSVAEPWVLLPILNSLKTQGTYTEFGNFIMANAVKDFIKELPNGEEDFFDELRKFIAGLYQKASPKSATYFLDKTPRYHLVVEDIIHMFDDGKFIFLWRNPLSIVASMLLTTEPKGRWNLFFYRIDLYKGIDNLFHALELNKEKIVSVRYEDIIDGSEKTLKIIFDYLGIEYSTDLLKSFSATQFKGNMGDKTGQEHYQELSKQPLAKWQKVLSNPIRKIWCKRYLYWLGNERLEMIGYDLDEIINELENLPFSMVNVWADIFWIVYGFFYTLLNPVVIKKKIKSLLKKERIYPSF